MELTEIKQKINSFLDDPKQKKLELNVPKGFKLTQVINPIKLARNKLALLLALRIIPSNFKSWYLRRLGMNIGQDVCIAGYVKMDPYFPELISMEMGTLVGGFVTINTHKLEHGKLTLGKVLLKEKSLIAGFATINPGVTINKNVILGIDAVAEGDAPEGTFFAGVPARVLKEWSDEEIDKYFGHEEIDPDFAKQVKLMTWEFRNDPEKTKIKFRNAGKRLNAGNYWYLARPVWRIYYNALMIELAYFAPWQWLRKLALRLMGAKIGKNVKIGKHPLFDQVYGDMVTIEDDVVFDNNVFIDGHEYTIAETIYARTRIKEGVHLHDGAYIRAGLTMGENAEIQKDARILKDIGDDEIWGGHPAKLIDKKMKWDIDEGESSFWIVSEPNPSYMRDFPKRFGFGPSQHLTYFNEKSVMKWCTLAREEKSIGKKLVRLFTKNPREMRRVIKDFLKDYQSVKTHPDRILLHREDDNLTFNSLNKLGDVRLFELFADLQKQYKSVWVEGFTIEPLDCVLGDELTKELEKYGCIQEEFNDLAVVPADSFISLEKQSLLQIALLVKEQGHDLDSELVKENISKHTNEFFWMQSSHARYKILREEDFRKSLKELLEKPTEGLKKELEDLKNHVTKSKKRKQELIKKYKIKGRARKLIRIVDEWGPIHDLRKEMFLTLVTQIEPVMQEIAKRKGYTLQELRNLSLTEISSLREKPFPKEIIQERAKGMAYWVYPDREEIITGEEAKKIAEEEFALDIKGITKFNGNCASKGRVKGKVRIIYGPSDLHKMQDGEILVTGMTRPEMVPVMKKAAAIVTDEGGITCHAAIVSRELGVPCIIGTKIATSVLKDGQEIEVNADEGIVKILK